MTGKSKIESTSMSWVQLWTRGTRFVQVSSCRKRSTAWVAGFIIRCWPIPILWTAFYFASIVFYDFAATLRFWRRTERMSSECLSRRLLSSSVRQWFCGGRTNHRSDMKLDRINSPTLLFDCSTFGIFSEENVFFLLKVTNDYLYLLKTENSDRSLRKTVRIPEYRKTSMNLCSRNDANCSLS